MAVALQVQLPQIPLLKEVESCLQCMPADARADHLHDGVLFDRQTKKYCVDKNTGHNSFMLYARSLYISRADDPLSWSWHKEKETHGSSSVLVDVAEMLNVNFLEIEGKFDTSVLSSGTTYEVVFQLKLRRNADTFTATLKLELPTKEKDERKVNFETKPREEWFEVVVGEFKQNPCDKRGEMKFSMTDLKNQQWKRGLVVKGAVIRPKKPCN